MPPVQGAVRVLCSDLLQLVYLIILISDLKFIYLILQKAPRTPVSSCVL